MADFVYVLLAQPAGFATWTWIISRQHPWKPCQGVNTALPHAGADCATNVPYLAPEALQGQPLSPATDVYAFAMLVCELLQGELVAANIAVQADLAGQSDGDAMASYAQCTLAAERCACRAAQVVHTLANTLDQHPSKVLKLWYTCASHSLRVTPCPHLLSCVSFVL